MKAITFTTRNVTAGQRNDAGEMVLRTLGDVTLTLQGMTRTEIAEWEWATDALNTRGISEDLFRLTVNGYKVVHPEAGVVGLLFQGAGTRVHVEWYDPANNDFFSAAWTRNLRHGAAQIINARQHAGHGLPADVRPEPYQAPAAQSPVWLKEGTRVRYTGTFATTFSDLGISEFLVYGCDCDDLGCRGRYELNIRLWDAPNYGPVTDVVAQHVHPDHVTPVAAELAGA
jgi:hypothetical protein